MGNLQGRLQQEIGERQWAEERLRVVITGAPIVLFTTDREGVLTLLESKGLEALEIEPAEAVGRPVFDALREVPHVGGDVPRALAGEEVTSIVELGEHMLETLCSPLRNPDGETTGVVGVATDITGRLLESKRRYRDLFERMPVGLYRTAADGQILDANPALVDMLGYPDRESLLAATAAPPARRTRTVLEHSQAFLKGPSHSILVHPVNDDVWPTSGQTPAPTRS